MALLGFSLNKVSFVHAIIPLCVPLGLWLLPLLQLWTCTWLFLHNQARGGLLLHPALRVRLLFLLLILFTLLPVSLLFPIFTFKELFPERRFLILVKDLEWVSLLIGRKMKWLTGMLRLFGYRIFFGIRILKHKENNLNIK